MAIDAGLCPEREGRYYGSPAAQHEAGLAVIDTPLTIDIIADPDWLGEILAAQAPGWTPGAARGYHAQSLGWHESQMLRRVDPAGRTIWRFFADEVSDPLGAEFYIGLPASVDLGRVATFVGGRKAAMLLHLRGVPWAVTRRMLDPRSATFKAFTNPKALTKLPDINNRRILDIELPSVNGTGTTRALAGVYGELALGGERLGITAETLAGITRPRPAALDLTFGTSPEAFGHTGSGGSFAYADPAARLGYAYVMNRAGYSLPTDPREIALRTALTGSLT